MNGIASPEEAVHSDVPQGSVPESLLYVLYINGIHDILVCLCLMFTDCIKSFRDISEVADMNILQDNLHQLDTWSQTWLLQFDHWKCDVMSVGFGGTLFRHIHISFCLHIGLHHIRSRLCNNSGRFTFYPFQEDNF